MGWFPVFADCMEREDFKSLTPTDKLFFWHLVSEFNRRGEFYQSDLEIAKTLATSEKTIRRGRAKLINMGLVKAKPGTRTKRSQIATRYSWVKYATMGEEGFFAQIHRYTFQVILDRLRNSHLKAGDVVVYICLYYWFWRNRGKHESRDRFYITKKDLQSLTNLSDAQKRFHRIYEGFHFSSGEHLFEYQYEYHRVLVRDWNWCADPENNEISRQNAETLRQEIKDLTDHEKQDRELKIQQKIIKTSKHPFEFFMDFYKKQYGRLPHYTHRIKKRFHEIEKNIGYSAIYRAINWYFTADIVPTWSGAQTRTLGNFVRTIDDILNKLGRESGGC